MFDTKKLYGKISIEWELKQMIKKVKVIFFCIFIVASVFFISKNVEATTIDMNYSLVNENKNSGKLHAGDEIIVSVSVNGEENGKIMAIFGHLEYDENILELVKDDESENSAKIELGNGWSIGNLSIDEIEENSDNKNSEKNCPKFLIYSSDENRENTAVYIRFRVKDNIKNVKSTNVIVKDIALYDLDHKEINTKVKDSSLNIKFSQFSKLNQKDMFVVILTIIVIIMICVIIAVIMYKNKKNKVSKH